MKPAILTPDAYLSAVTLRDLADPAAGPHAMQRLVDAVRDALTARWGCEARIHRAHPVVPLEHNYDRLRYPPDGAARDARYTRYVSETTVLRSHSTAMIPAALRALAADPPDDVVLLCPGLVYRRDQIDRIHTGEPHQMDVWRISRRRLQTGDLHEMIDAVLGALLPGWEYRRNPADHPYTTNGLELEVCSGGEWVEVGECGLAHPAVLGESGLSPDRWSGLAMGLGLDRLLMLAKGIDDIRILRSADPRVAAQMLDLEPYQPVSSQPPVRRDLSVAVDASRTPEELGDRVRQALGERVESLESAEVLAETEYDEVPPPARERIGMLPGQKNVLVRIVIRDLVRTLTSQEANRLRDAVYASLHEGSAWQWADAPPEGAAVGVVVG
jgi:phenylalanyl-tRNA synthetase alpha chain